jgi:hypothetical protein
MEGFQSIYFTNFHQVVVQRSLLKNYSRPKGVKPDNGGRLRHAGLIRAFCNTYSLKELE